MVSMKKNFKNQFFTFFLKNNENEARLYRILDYLKNQKIRYDGQVLYKNIIPVCKNYVINCK